MVGLLPKPISVAEYFEREKQSEVRHEFVEGIMYAMAGTTRQHNLVAGNVFGHFLNLKAGKPCRVYHADMRLRIGNDYYYPDGMVVCAPVPDDDLHETDPCILVEVLSDGTQGTDLREKAIIYRQLKSLNTYLVIDPKSRSIRHHFRDGEGDWQIDHLTDEGAVKLPCLEGTVSLEEIYQGIFG
jgi:Uma2 family endonuclease